MSKTDLTIIIPSFQEEKSIEKTVMNIYNFFIDKSLDFEIIVVDDNSDDNTKLIMRKVSKSINNVNFILSSKVKGFGNSIVQGLEIAKGKYVSFMMADMSDSPFDLLNYYNELENNNNLDCVFGDRWSSGQIKEYPLLKRIINRLGNHTISILFGSSYKDFTNSFKIYKKEALMNISPIISNHFSITLELPLKMITRGYKYKVIRNSWENREHGVSNLKILDSIFTYSLIIFYCLIDKYFWNKRYVNNK